jgi:hypothetical protein
MILALLLGYGHYRFVRRSIPAFCGTGETDKHGLETEQLLDSCGTVACCPVILIGIFPETVVGRNSLVGVATRCGLDGTGFEFRWGRNFPHSSRPVLDPPRVLYTEYRVSFPGVKRQGRGVNHPLPSRAEVKERV